MDAVISGVGEMIVEDLDIQGEICILYIDSRKSGAYIWDFGKELILKRERKV